jgi:hypothetical protein
MRVVSNTSPVSNLAIIGRLDVLRGQFGVLNIPEAVWIELSRLEHAAGKWAIEKARADGWLTVSRLSDRALASVLTASLDLGESEAISLVVESGAELLLMDESAGRATARSLGIEITGTLGVLLKEKQAGRIPSLQVEVERLVSEAGFFVSGKVRATFLAAAGEG